MGQGMRGSTVCGSFNRNGEVVEGADHSTVVQLIRQSGKQVVLSIISVSDEEARRLEPDTSSSSSTPGVEYYERRSVPVSLPETEKLSENGKEYVVSVVVGVACHDLDPSYDICIMVRSLNPIPNPKHLLCNEVFA